jgi:hypothetical protein
MHTKYYLIVWNSSTCSDWSFPCDEVRTASLLAKFERFCKFSMDFPRCYWFQILPVNSGNFLIGCRLLGLYGTYNGICLFDGHSRSRPFHLDRVWNIYLGSPEGWSVTGKETQKEPYKLMSKLLVKYHNSEKEFAVQSVMCRFPHSCEKTVAAVPPTKEFSLSFSGSRSSDS